MSGTYGSNVLIFVPNMDFLFMRTSVNNLMKRISTSSKYILITVNINLFGIVRVFQKEYLTLLLIVVSSVDVIFAAVAFVEIVQNVIVGVLVDLWIHMHLLMYQEENVVVVQHLKEMMDQKIFVLH